MKLYTFTGTAVDRDGVCQSQTPAEAGNLTINGAKASGGVATFGEQQHVSIYSGSDLRAKTFTVTGTQANGQSISEAVTGPNATTVYTTRNFKTVTQVAVSAGTGAAVEIGVQAAFETPWQALDPTRPLKSISVQLTSGASLTYELQWANYVWASNPPVTLVLADESTVTSFADAAITNKTASTLLETTTMVQAVRLKVTSYVSGTVTLAVNEGLA